MSPLQPRPAWRIRALVVVALAVAVSAAGGSLFVGASVRGSLEELALRRLGRTDITVDAPRFFREGLSDDLRNDPRFREAFSDAVPLVALEGTVTDVTGGRHLPRVAVYGVDDRFWQFHGIAGVIGPSADEVLLSPELRTALGVEANGVVDVLTDEPPDAPLESLHGRKDGRGRTLRLRVSQRQAMVTLGVLPLFPDRRDLYSVFVPLGLLQQAPARQGRVNRLLVAERADRPPAAGSLEALIQQHAAVEDYGLRLRSDERHHLLVVESDLGIIDDTRGDSVTRAALDIGGMPMPVMTALVTTIRHGDREVPYSFVTSVELQVVAPAVHTEESERPPIVLNEWTARRLNASIGDQVTLEYPTWTTDGRLQQDAADFEVAGIVPIAGPADDPGFTPSLPGITGALTMRQWAARVPIDFARVHPDDERYWAQYGPLPKAFVPPQVGRALWRSRVGALTSIRITPPEGAEPMPLASAREQIETRLRQQLAPAAAGFTVTHIRSNAVDAARDRERVGRSFMVYSLPLALAAILLSSVLFSAGRLPPGDAWRLASAGTIAGLAGAFIYAALVTWRLRTVWFDAGVGGWLGESSWSGLAACLVAGTAGLGVLAWVSPLWRRRTAVVACGLLAATILAVAGTMMLRRPAAVPLDAPQSAAGGYALFVRTTLPLVRDPNGPEGLEQLGLAEMPGVRTTPLRLHDDPVRPGIAGVSRAFIDQGRFTFTRSLDRSDEERLNPWRLLEREQRDPDDPGAAPRAPVVPVIAGAGVMPGRMLGRELVIHASGHPVRLRVVAELSDSVLDGTILMSETHFLALFPDDQGFSLLLIEAPAASAAMVKRQLDERLATRGGRVESAGERLQHTEERRHATDSIDACLLAASLIVALAGLVAGQFLVL